MAEIIKVQQEEDFFGVDWYDPTCYAVEILDTKYEKVEVDEVTDQLSLMELWVSTPTGNSTLTLYQGL
jgi:hypothetical protein